MNRLTKRALAALTITTGLGGVTLAAGITAGATSEPPPPPTSVEANDDPFAIGAEDTLVAEVTVISQWRNDRIEYRVDGANASIVRGDVDGEGAVDVVESRVVDGEYYWYGPGVDGTSAWIHDVSDDIDERMPSFPSPADPHELRVRLESAGFEAAGPSTIGITPTSHLVATTPDAVDAADLPWPARPVVEDYTIDSIELWVDDSGIVRRIDVAITELVGVWDAEAHPELSGVDPDEKAEVSLPPPDSSPDREEQVASHISIEFTSIGQPLTIEAPADATDQTSVG